MKFRRKSEPTSEPVAESTAVAPDDTAAHEDVATAASPRTDGPFDESQVQDDGVQRVDLGSLLIVPSEGRELRLQVDEASGAVQAVLLTGQDGALELQAFAAPRNGDLWGTVRPQIIDDINGRGGRAEEREGRFGTELVAQMPVRKPDGEVGLQPTRIVGINGQRWMLRASFLGRPAVQPEAAGEWEDALAQVVVRRGAGAMPVGEALPATLPEQARRVK
ncbi:MAG: hypothetical protein AVDCRST_MAG60-497 [uncultured Nocardioides sp.]|uniref:DUF3710 domain-containing protein n=1 Tax=uncultured Nocardioides sp. TaxID=198441 RepID=A0A6J4N624_9ACTN|nr:MAG: hypothetical protein AVDCRST_MAG60-497 [uncultured Nocardioides sp.]